MKIKQIDGKALYRLEKGDKTVYFSYEVPIAYVIENELHVTSRKYSPTTTKHKNIIKNKLEVNKNIITESHDDFMRMISLYF